MWTLLHNGVRSIDEVLDRLAAEKVLPRPADYRIILSGHSGGGLRIASMLAGGSAELVRRLDSVVLFEAINNKNDLATVTSWVRGHLNQLRSALTGVPVGAPAGEAALAGTPRLRGYYSSGGSYVGRYDALRTSIADWFAANGKALGGWRPRVEDMFRVVEIHGTVHETVVRGVGGDATAGPLADALRANRDPSAKSLLDTGATRPKSTSSPSKSAGSKGTSRTKKATRGGRFTGDLPSGIVGPGRLGKLKTDEETAFRRAVYEEQLRRALATKEFFPGLTKEEKGEVQGRPIHKFAETDARDLLKAADQKLRAEKKAGIPLAVGCASFGVGNAYRDPERDFRAWKGAYAKHLGKTAAARAKADGGEYGTAARDLLVRRLQGKKAVPGFSNHTKGLAIDFVTVQNGVELTSNSDQAKAWQESWFHHWLKDNAITYKFHPLSTEEWHWDHDAGAPSPTPDRSSIAGPGPTSATPASTPTTAPTTTPTTAPTTTPTTAATTTATSPTKAAAATGAGEVSVRFGSRAKADAVAAGSLDILRDVLRACGLRSALISSTARNPVDQARAMYQNLAGSGKGQGVAKQRTLYGPAGDRVIDVFVAQRDLGRTPAEIRQAMADAVVQIGPSKVSRHCGDPAVLNVFDVAPSSIGDDERQTAFVAAATAEVGKRVSRFLPYPKDPGHHFEIKP